MSEVSKKTGGAYIMVLVFVLSVFVLTHAALMVTTTSRRLTARQENFLNLYTIAVSGNQQAMSALNQHILANIAPDTPLDEIPTVAAGLKQQAVQANMFTQHNFSITYTPATGGQIHDSFHINTVLTIDTQGVVATTIARKYINGVRWPGYTRVESLIVWNKNINSLDDYLLTMVNLMRVAV